MDALLLGEALRRACRRADGIVGHGLRRAGYFGLDVSLLRKKPADPGGQPTGRAEGLDRYAIKKIFSGEKFLDVRAEFLFGLRKHSGRDLLTTDFEEELDALFLSGCLHART